jgi:hypothetical protein
MKMYFFCNLENDSRAIGHHMTSFQLDLIIMVVANAHVIKCEKNMSSLMKFLDLVVELFSFNFF